MLLFLTAVLTLSCLAMAALLYAKHWELAHQKLLFAGARPHIAHFASHVLMAFEHHMPATIDRVVRKAVSWFRVRAKDVIARSLLSLEHGLESLLNMLRHSFSPARQSGVQASSQFLREVAEHKRKLTRVSRIRSADKTGIEYPEIE